MIQDLVAGWAEMQAALPEYLEAEHFFEGQAEEVFASDRIRTLIRQTGEAYKIGLASIPVTQLAERVELVMVIAPDNEQATARIEQIWEANDMDVHYPDLILKTFEYGDAYLQAWPVLDDQAPLPGEAGADDQLTAAGVELNVHGPKNCRVFYDPENQRRKAFAIKRWCVKLPEGDEVWRVDLWYATAMERWISKPGAVLTEPDSWMIYLEEGESPDSWLVENPYGEIPFIHYRTALPYGRPVHERGYGAQNAVTKMLTTQITTTDSHGWPQRWALTDKGAVLDAANDGPDWDDDQYADETGQGTVSGASSQLRSGPGILAILDGMKAVGQFDAADPAKFTDPAELYVRLLATLTGTPLHYFDPSGDVPSGESLKTADMPMVKKAKRMLTMLRGPVVETWLLCLEIDGLRRPQRLDVKWAPIEAATGLDDWQIVQAKQAAGVPTAQTLTEAGYEAEQVATWLDQEAEAMALAQRVDLLGKLADAVTKLGAGVGAGVLDEATAAAVIATILPQVAPPPGSEGQVS